MEIKAPLKIIMRNIIKININVINIKTVAYYYSVCSELVIKYSEKQKCIPSLHQIVTLFELQKMSQCKC